MRCSGRGREQARGTFCARGLSRGRLILARIAFDACGLSLTWLVEASNAMRAPGLGGIVIRCKLSGQARFAVALPYLVLVFSVVAICAHSAL
jgi:hypothetical protein